MFQCHPYCILIQVVGVGDWIWGEGEKTKKGIGSRGVGLMERKEVQRERREGVGVGEGTKEFNDTPLLYVLIWITDTSRCSIAASTCKAHVYHSCHIVHIQPTNYII